MGRKSAKVEGLSDLGIRVMKVEFREGRTLLDQRASSTKFTSSSPSRSKKARKNSTGKPSGPGVLSFLKDLRAVSTYFKETLDVKEDQSSREIKDGKSLMIFI